VSYEVHITRADSWVLSDEIQIGREEWQSAARDANLISTGDPGYFYARAVRGNGEDASFEWDEGRITVIEPDEPTLVKMLQLAATLDAIVQGDEDEIYRMRADGTTEVVDGE
jgi:hypothetical protein